MNKEAHEKIRVGSIFERVVENAEAVIQLRDEEDFPTRFVIRLISQEDNKSEWESYKEFWNARLSQSKGDFVAKYDMHNYGGYVADKLGKSIEAIEREPCHFVFDVLIILADGTLSLCPADFLEAKFGLGKVPDQTPLKAFNSDSYIKIRETHQSGNKNDIPLCKNCTIPYSETTRETGWEVVAI